MYRCRIGDRREKEGTRDHLKHVFDDKCCSGALEVREVDGWMEGAFPSVTRKPLADPFHFGQVISMHSGRISEKFLPVFLIHCFAVVQCRDLK